MKQEKRKKIPSRAAPGRRPAGARAKAARPAPVVEPEPREPVEGEVIDGLPGVIDVYPEGEGPAEGGGAPAAPEGAEAGSGALVRLDPMMLYITEIRRYPVLTPAEEKQLAILAYENKDEEAARKLVTSNLRLVVKIAFEFKRAYKNVLDLIQEGNIGLLMALKKFDPYRGVRFISYAAWWIRAYILRYILNNWRMVKIGTTQVQRKLFFNLHKEKARLERLGIAPEPAAIAASLDVDEKDVIEMDRRLAATDTSLDSPVRRESDRELARIETIGDPAAGADELLSISEFNESLQKRLAEFGETLDGKEKIIFEQRLVSDRPLTLQEIGDRYGITRERVRQVEARVMKRLKDHLRLEMGDYFDDAG